MPDWVLQFLDDSNHSPEQVLDDQSDQDEVSEIESQSSDERQVEDRVSGFTDIPDCPPEQCVCNDFMSLTGEPESEGSSVRSRSQGRYPLRRTVRKPERLNRVLDQPGRFSLKGGVI